MASEPPLPSAAHQEPIRRCLRLAGPPDGKAVTGQRPRSPGTRRPPAPPPPCAAGGQQPAGNRLSRTAKPASTAEPGNTPKTILLTCRIDAHPASAPTRAVRVGRKCQRSSLACALYSEMKGDVMVIDCGRCAMRGAGCRDCVVAVLSSARVTDHAPQAPDYLDEAELRALRVLADAGMVPPLRLSLPRSRVRPGPEPSLTRKRRDGSVTLSSLGGNRHIVMK